MGKPWNEDEQRKKLYHDILERAHQVGDLNLIVMISRRLRRLDPSSYDSDRPTGQKVIPFPSLIAPPPKPKNVIPVWQSVLLSAILFPAAMFGLTFPILFFSIK